jgi:hypothetical protein
MKQYLIPASVGAAALGVLFAILGVIWLAAMMLGTAAVLWLVNRRQERVTDDQLFVIEQYANKPEDWK